ncbi:MAG: osmotically inducible protein OsmC [Chlorobi bacterium]|nr:osmotically inducible protein OsmC [Chlorobiota bacterium]
MSVSKAYLKQVNGLTFVGKTDSNHWVTIDGPEDFFGSDAAIRPKELLLLSLAGCTASDVVAILQKKRVKVDNFEMNVTAEMTETHPKVYSKIDLEFVVYGKDIKEKDVERAIQLSEEVYCGVTAMLKSAVKITTSYRIVKPEE